MSMNANKGEDRHYNNYEPDKIDYAVHGCALSA